MNVFSNTFRRRWKEGKERIAAYKYSCLRVEKSNNQGVSVNVQAVKTPQDNL